jgi:acyl-coenzyme A synthetase/AMP-(fatty) acid ligase
VQETQEHAGKSLKLYRKLRSAKNLHPCCVVIPSERPGHSSPLIVGDIWWDTFLHPAVSQPDLVLAFQPEHVSPDTIMNVLFSSGTTGAPKAIPWTHTTPFRCAHALPVGMQHMIAAAMYHVMLCCAHDSQLDACATLQRALLVVLPQVKWEQLDS